MLWKSLYLHAFVQICNESMHLLHAQIMHLLCCQNFEIYVMSKHLSFASGKYLGRYQGFQLFYITNRTDFHPVSCKHVGAIVFFIGVLMFACMAANRQVLL